MAETKTPKVFMMQCDTCESIAPSDTIEFGRCPNGYCTGSMRYVDCAKR